jgi:hypothetical protein
MGVGRDVGFDEGVGAAGVAGGALRPASCRRRASGRLDEKVDLKLGSRISSSILITSSF